jgi:hypothetical protein
MGMQQVIHAALFTPQMAGDKLDGRWGMVIGLIGPPGSAKSSIIREVCDNAGMWCEVLSPGQKGEGAFGAVPVPKSIGDMQVIGYPPPEHVLQSVKVDKDGKEVPGGEPGCVFIDEANTAAPHIQPALLSLTLDAQIGGFQYPGRTRRILAMNEEKDAASGWAFSPAQCNRVCWIPWQEPSTVEFVGYWTGGMDDSFSGVNALEEEQRVLNAWHPAWAKAVGRIAGILKKMPSMLRMEQKSDERSFATPRSIAGAMHAIATAQVHGLSSEERGLLIRGWCGEAWYKQFLAFEEAADMPDAGDILDGRVQWAHDPSELWRSSAVITECTTLIVQDSDKARKTRRGAALWTILVGMLQGARDVAFQAGHTLARHSISITGRDATKVMAKLEEYKEALRKA